jgi:GTP cyclohydrolase IIa
MELTKSTDLDESSDQQPPVAEQPNDYPQEVPKQPATADCQFQFTVFQLDDYGPWTTTPDPRWEMDLQQIQSGLHAELAGLIGSRGGYVFDWRKDNLLGITNTIAPNELERIQTSIRNRYPITISIGNGTGQLPAEAVTHATAQLQQAGSAQDAQREEILRGSCAPTSSKITISHWDIVDCTGKITDTRDAYTAQLKITEWVHALQRHLWEEHGGIASFVGGDNVIAALPPLSESAYRDALNHVLKVTGLETKVGVGCGQTAEEAGIEAKHSLEECREEDLDVRLPSTEDPVFSSLWQEVRF